MELCTGGNLYEVIDAPENAYGLSEQEFLRVMIDVKQPSNDNKINYK